MGFLLLLFVCFLAQCVFSLADEHLLIILIVVLLFLSFSTFVGFLNSSLYEKQVLLSKQILKNRIINVFFLEEIDKLISEFEFVVHSAFSLNFELFESLPSLITEIYDQFALFQTQTQLTNLLELAVNEIIDELNDTQIVLIDRSIDEFLDED